MKTRATFEVDEELSLSVTSGLDSVGISQWNAVAGQDNPFVCHQLLHALESEDCLGERTGWFPHHLLAHRGEHLVGAMPAYLKTNSYGEFVFDWAFADAYERHGLQYYPKLVCAVPFTPATGPRLLRIDDEGFPIQPYGVRDNPHSILDVADIVYVNPANTGFSRVLDPEIDRGQAGYPGAEEYRQQLGVG